MENEKKTNNTEEAKSDWYSEGYPEIQTELELVNEGDVILPVSRYEELVRAEHTVELIKSVYTTKLFKYDSERAAVTKLLLGLETADE